MDGITPEQIRSAQLFENSDRKNPALVNVLKQVCSRNKAAEKRKLWEQKDREDNGSRTTISVRTAAGELRVINTVPKDAKVTENNVNKYEQERARNAETKEDTQLNRFCDGNDHAWRPDTFFTEACGEEECPPWPVRPSELFANPQICMKIMAETMEKRKQKKLQKKGVEKKGKKDKKKKKKGKVKKDDKKSKKDKKRSKKDKKHSKGKKDKKEKRKKKKEDRPRSSTDSDSSSEAGDDPVASEAPAGPAVAAGTTAAPASPEEEVAAASSSSSSSASGAGDEEEPDWSG